MGRVNRGRKQVMEAKKQETREQRREQGDNDKRH
jgi:hypothetical protein